jgi:putative transposase
VDRDHDAISIRRQCDLLGVNRASLYYTPLGESEENLQLMRWIDEQYIERPFFGSRLSRRHGTAPPGRSIR